MKKAFSKILYVLIIVLLAPILLVNITIMVKSIIEPDEIPGILGYKPMIVLTGSMEPTINTGDLVIVKESNTPPKVKDIISYRDSEDLIVTHRVVDIETKDGKTYYITQGDANNTTDNIDITNSMVEGIYAFKVPGLGKILQFIQTPIGIVIVVMAIIIIVLILATLGKNFRNPAIGFIDKNDLKEFEEFKKNKQKKEQEDTDKDK